MKEIRHILEAYDAIDWSQERAALATVVSVEESAYRRIGARMLVKNTGDWVGGISGGCLEGDALRRAQAAIFKNKPSLVVYDTLEDDEHQIGVGLGCNGRIEVLFVPLDPSDKDNPVEVLRRVTQLRKPGILWQDISKKTAQGVLHESATSLQAALGIASIELERARQLTLQREKSQVFTLPTAAGESAQILLEWITPELRIVVVGDNYDVRAFAGIARELGWELHLIGTLRKFGKDLLRQAASLRHYDDADQLSLDDYTAIILMSHDYRRDMQMVRHFLPEVPRYLGMLGPKKRMLKMDAELRESSGAIKLSEFVHLYSPVGLDIGAASPEEIALSIAAEIVSHWRGRSGSPLRHREGPIYDRNR